MLWTILVILLVLWLIGLLAHVGGSFIHLLLVVAAIVLIINLVTGRRTVYKLPEVTPSNQVGLVGPAGEGQSLFSDR